MNRTTKIITATAIAAVLVGGATVAAAQSQDDVTGDDLALAGAAALAEADGETITEVDVDANGYDVEVRRADGTRIDVDLDHDFNVLRSQPDDDRDDDRDDDGVDRDDDSDDVAVTNADREQASQAALAETGGGTVTDVERDHDGYDVEVRLDDGSEIDLDLANDFEVLRTEVDD